MFQLDSKHWPCTVGVQGDKLLCDHMSWVYTDTYTDTICKEFMQMANIVVWHAIPSTPGRRPGFTHLHNRYTNVCK